VILATLEMEIGRTVVRGQPQQKVHKTPSQPVVGYDIVLLSSQLCGEAQIGDHRPPDLKQNLMSKITNAKKDW
jgi:hypothetical protein